jgi:hypothetical protein
LLMHSRSAVYDGPPAGAEATTFKIVTEDHRAAYTSRIVYTVSINTVSISVTVVIIAVGTITFR